VPYVIAAGVAQLMEWLPRTFSGSVPTTLELRPPPLIVEVSDPTPVPIGALEATATGTSMVSVVLTARSVVRVQVNAVEPALDVQLQSPPVPVVQDAVLTVMPVGSVPAT